jgi:uncharacterized protein (TIGR02596 family)
MNLANRNRNDLGRTAFKVRCQMRLDTVRSRAFTLIELLAVIAVIGLITATTVPMLFSTMKANRLSAAGEELVNRISLAQQMAVSRNHEIELRFYHYVDPEDPASKDHYRSTLIAQPAPDPNAPGSVETIVLSDMSYLRNGIVIANDETLSPILTEASRNDYPDADGRIRGATASYKTIRFFPDGSCDVILVTNKAYLTVVEERDFAVVGGIPKNFFAVQVDHYTSRATTYRP